jgi:hypothetical protein
MNFTLVRSRSAVVTSRCCASKKSETNPVSVSRKRFEAKRGVSLKENLNKLLVIANADIKEYGDFFKELDEIHKKEVNAFIDKVKAGGSSPASSSSSEDEGENIFVSKE